MTSLSTMKYRITAALAATSCSYAFVHAPPSPVVEVKPAEIECTDSYGVPIADLVAGGVAGIPLGRAIGLAFWDLGRKLNGHDPYDHDWWKWWLIPSFLGAAALFASYAHGREKVYECRRAKGMPMEGEDIVIKQVADARAAQLAKCATSVPAGARTDVVITDPPHETVELCPAEGTFAEGDRGGSIVIRGDVTGTHELGDLRNPRDTIREEIGEWLRQDPGGAQAYGNAYIYEPECPVSAVLARPLYISTTDWRTANQIARAAVVVVRDRRLTQWDAVVIAVNHGCL